MTHPHPHDRHTASRRAGTGGRGPIHPHDLHATSGGAGTAGPAAVLWDMDGTLVNTEPYWIAAETELVEAFGGAWSHDDALQLVGAGLWHSARVLQGYGVALEEREIIDRLTDRVLAQLIELGVPWRPGAQELLGALRKAGIPTALVTMSVRRMAHHVADQIEFEGFDVVISGDDVTHSKPHPEAYLTAAAALGVDPNACLAIEDSEPGAASASAAGAVVLGVPFMVPIPDESVHATWTTLAGRGVDDLVDLFHTAGAR